MRCETFLQVFRGCKSNKPQRSFRFFLLAVNIGRISDNFYTPLRCGEQQRSSTKVLQHRCLQVACLYTLRQGLHNACLPFACVYILQQSFSHRDVFNLPAFALFNKASVKQISSVCLIVYFIHQIRIILLPALSELHIHYITCDLNSNQNRDKSVTWSHPLPPTYPLCKGLHAFACMFILGACPHFVTQRTY